MRVSSATEGGKHEADDFAQELLLGLQAAFHFGHEGGGEAQVFSGLMDGLEGALGIGTLLSDVLPCFETTAFEGFGLSLGVSFHRGHGDFLRVQCFSLQIEGNRPQFEASEMKERTQVAEV
jgi:hypothetical protein